MEFTKLISEFHRMCSKVHNGEGCHECPIEYAMGFYGGDCATWIVDYPEKADEIITKWSEENPVRTNMTRFLEHYPETRIADDGYPSIAPCILDKELFTRRDSTFELCKGIECDKCRKKYWEKEIK